MITDRESLEFAFAVTRTMDIAEHITETLIPKYRYALGGIAGCELFSFDLEDLDKYYQLFQEYLETVPIIALHVI